MICKECGKKLDNGYSYCPYCGVAADSTKLRNNNQVSTLKRKNIEYRDEKILINYIKRGIVSDFNPSYYISEIPQEETQKINNLIYEKVKELGKDGWEPVESKLDVDSLIGFRTSSKLIRFRKRVGLFRYKDLIESITIRFKRET